MSILNKISAYLILFYSFVGCQAMQSAVLQRPIECDAKYTASSSMIEIHKADGFNQKYEIKVHNDDIELSRVSVISGPCVYTIKANNFGFYKLNGGQYLKGIRSNSKLKEFEFEAIDRDISHLFKSEYVEPTDFENENLLNSIFINETKKYSGEFLGMWNNNANKKSIVGYINNSNSNKKLDILLSSKKPFHGELTYFGSIHGDSGSLTVIHLISNDKMFIYDYIWKHK